MPLTVPDLDNRRFQQIVDETKKRIPHYFDGWTDHNVSDPGVTLIELFAWMMDMLLYRLNQVPDLHYIKFMEFLGIELKAPRPAQTAVTFWLSSPQENTIAIPAGTEVASTQTENRPSIIFTTDSELEIRPAKPMAVVIAKQENGREVIHPQEVERLQAGLDDNGAINFFSATPQDNEAFYIGFENDLSHHVLVISLDCLPAEGRGSEQAKSPYAWEVSPGRPEAPWAPCELSDRGDTTGSLNQAGSVELHLPAMGKASIHAYRNLYWVRLRLLSASERDEAGVGRYELSPRLRQLKAESWGGTTTATHAEKMEKELLGYSDGSPGQGFRLRAAPIVSRTPEETLKIIYPNGREVTWREVPNFADSGQHDEYFTLDSATGEIRLGPAIRQPDGQIRYYGAIPPAGAALYFESYRYHSGADGNVDAGRLNTLKSSIPFIDRVMNRQPASGGLAQEDLENAKIRAPKLLRSLDRAVTTADFEFLVQDHFEASLGRVKCLQPRPARDNRVRPGHVYVLVIPKIKEAAGRLTQAQLTLAKEKVAEIERYLDEKRLLTMRLDTRPPEFHWVSVQVNLQITENADRQAIEAEAIKRLNRFINPLVGGMDGTGWPFGRDLLPADIYPCLQGIAGIQYIRSARLYPASAEGERQLAPEDVIHVVTYGLVASAEHEIIFTES